jgi:excisionase family DNA binding protein
MSDFPDPRQRPTITVEDAADLLHISRASAYQGVNKGEIPSIRVGRRILVPTAALLEMLGLKAAG